MTAQQTQYGSATQPSIESMEEAIKENPSDFYKWEEYVATIEQQDDKNKLKSVYEQFLSEFPLLYGYWKKYAELVRTLENNLGSVIAVYEKGVNAVLYSVDLWASYCIYVAENSNDLTQIRNVFERAVDKVGSDYLSQELWDQYISFETSQEEFSRISNIYDRLLRIPVRDLARYFEQYKQHIATRPTSELVSPVDAEKLQSLDETTQKQTLLGWKEVIYNETNTELERIAPFEKDIERPYFHAQPLDDKQLENWRLYLETEEARETVSNDRLSRLYEKCLVSCCMYLEFWRRYLRNLENSNRYDDARDLLVKLTTVYRKRIPEAFLIYANFEEQYGDSNSVGLVYRDLLAGVGKGHLQSIIEYIHFQRRQSKSPQETYELFTSLRGDLDAKSQVYLDVQRANFVHVALNDADKARTEFQQIAATNGSVSALSWLGWIEFEARQPNVNHTANLEPLYSKVLDQRDLDRSDKVKILERLQEHALHLGTDIKHARNIEKSIISLKYTEEARGKKRKAEEEAEGGRDNKIPRTAPDYAQAQMGQQYYGAYGSNFGTPYGATDPNAAQYAQYYQTQ